MAIKPKGGGVKSLTTRPLREELFFAASLMPWTNAKSVTVSYTI